MLTELDLTNNTELSFLSCWNNKISQLDLTKNNNLEEDNVIADDEVEIIR